jgi:membrane protease YdiL (CAAX protease family)
MEDQVQDDTNISEPDLELEPENELEYVSDDKWYGVPPKGEEPLPRQFLIFEGKWAYVAMIICIIILEICIWAVYRWSTADLFESFGTAPTIHLLPIILFWFYVRKERGLPFVFTKKLLLTGVIVGFVAAIIWRLLEEFTYFGFATAAGGTAGPLEFINFLETADLFILMTFVMYFIVGPVEELEFRGFAQDQTARALPNFQALDAAIFQLPFLFMNSMLFQHNSLMRWLAGSLRDSLLVYCICIHGTSLRVS